MDKETILKLSRKENSNKGDEYELAVHASASKLSNIIGGNICAILTLLGLFLFDSTALCLGVLTLHFSMGSTENLVKYIKLKKKKYLPLCILEFVAFITSFVLIFITLR